MHIRSALTVLISLALAAPAAHAATVQPDIYDQCSYPGAACDTATPARALTYRAAPGEANRVKVTRAGMAVTLHDDGATLQVKESTVPEAKGTCAVVTEHDITCDVTPLADGELTLTALVVKLGDGADKLAFDTGIFGAAAKTLATYTQIDGGTGDDAITGTASRDFVVAGTGRDTVATGAGADVVKSKDRQKDNVNCGSGRDRAQADKQDRLRSCEAAKRS